MVSLYCWWLQKLDLMTLSLHFLSLEQIQTVFMQYVTIHI